MNNRTKIIITGIILLITLLSAYGTYLFYTQLQSGGTIKPVGNIKIYWDIDKTNEATFIDWGTLEPDEVVNKTLYIWNNSTIQLIHNMNITNWNPSNTGEFIYLTWNREGYISGPNELFDATLTLTISPNITNITSFAMNINIYGNEVVL